MSSGRSLTDTEILIVKGVFQNSLPDSTLKVESNGLRRPRSWRSTYTAISAGIGRYEIYMGEIVFNTRIRALGVGDLVYNIAYSKDPAKSDVQYYKATLVHEMTHVWQGHYNTFGIAGVWASSIKCQIQRQGNTYLYGEGNLKIKAWDDFAKEEQAQIVEDWYKFGMKPTDPRFPFIRDNIRNGKT